MWDAEIGGTFERLGPGPLQLGDDILGRPRTIDESFEQAVGGQPIGTVKAGAGDLAGCPETRKRRPPVVIDRHAADHVMGTRTDRDPVAGDVQVEVAA